MLEQLATVHPLLPAVAGSLILLALAFLADIIVKRLLLVGVRRAASRLEHAWAEALLEHKVFARFAQLAPAAVIYFGISQVPDYPQSVESIVRHVVSAYMILMITLTVTTLMSAANGVYEKTAEGRRKPIKGFVQLAQVAVYIVGGILIIAALADRSPNVLLGGLGAMTAVLLIVFRDTLLSLVASLQLTGQDLVRVGDWLEVPQFGADGDVIDVALYTITVQNWDKTISTIPTHALVAGSFKNWRGMSEAGGRRIKRSIGIDVNTIRFLTDAEIERFKGFALLKDYISDKEAELRAWNAEHRGDADVNARRLTNVGTFRAYVVNYLRAHPKIHQGMTLIVRQLQPGPEGLPIEIYAFTNDTNWVAYEGIQADIFDHLFAVAGEFGLRVFQAPAGTDFEKLGSGS